MTLRPSGHVDTFARDNLPPEENWPDLLLDGFDYPDRLNAAVELTDAMVDKGFGDHTALIGNGRRRTYKELTDWTNRLAHVLVEDLGVQPGNRVLIRSANNPAMVACWLAATKAGAVVVNTMPMLRAGELVKYVEKAEVQFALHPRLYERVTRGGEYLGGLQFLADGWWQENKPNVPHVVGASVLDAVKALPHGLGLARSQRPRQALVVLV